MSAEVETTINQIPTVIEGDKQMLVKPTQTQNNTNGLTTTPQASHEKTLQHPLHQYDFTIMSKFFESCVGKLKENNPKWQPNEWMNNNPVPNASSLEQSYDWPNPMLFSQKQRVYEAFARLARESGEPMILMPNFDYGDIMNFERFLQALKTDGVNSIGRYKQYLVNKDMRKFEVDLVVIHPRYGIMLFEIKDCDHFDSKRRNRARMQLNNARSCFESMARLIFEAKGWSLSEAQIPITEFVALPNVQEKIVVNTPSNTHLPGSNHNNSTVSNSSNSGRNSRQLHYLIKSDLENNVEFAKWWNKTIVEPKVAQQQQAEAENKVNKFDTTVINWMLGLINCIRNNSILPVVYPETGEIAAVPVAESINTSNTTPTESTETPVPENPENQSQTPSTNPAEKEKTQDSQHQFQPALNIHAEFFQAEHEEVRSQSRVFVTSKDSEKVRKTICLQTLWLLLNDSQKKISVVCSEMNKPYYEDFFARQRKIYNNLNHLRFYTDLQSCAVNGQHTLKNSGETWFFDSGIKGTFSEVVERIKGLNSFWIFSTQQENFEQFKTDMETLNVKCMNLDHIKEQTEKDSKHFSMPWLSGVSLKFPLRLQCDLLIIGDMISVNQLKHFYRYLKSNSVLNQSSYYQNMNSSHYSHHNNYHNNPQYQQLNFNPVKKFKSIKFIRGGSIDNLRNSLKMHDSIHAPVVLMHVGDEDLFKTRNSGTTVERVKEMATLVKEYCPKSFVVLSTLMRRMSRTENGVSNEVNKGIMGFCKQTRDTLNCHYMLNNHFDPDYHTQEGRFLTNKGLRLYVENVLFVVDYFLIKNNKQQ